MLTPSQIIERYCSGQPDASDDQMIVSTPVLPTRWTELDTKEIGLPVVIGHSATGFVGVIESVPPTGTLRWIGESSHERFADAQKDVVERATSMKQENASGGPAT